MNQIVRFHGTISWQLFKRPQWKHLGRRLLILLLFPLLMTGYTYWTQGTLTSMLVALVISSLWVPMMLVVSLFIWRRMYMKTPSLHQQLAGSVSSEKFILEAVTGRTEMTWSQFVRIRDCKDFLLLYHGPYQFNILAREFFESDATWETARSVALRDSAAPA